MTSANYRMQLSGRGRRVTPNRLGQPWVGRFLMARRALQVMRGR